MKFRPTDGLWYISAANGGLAFVIVFTLLALGHTSSGVAGLTVYGLLQIIGAGLYFAFRRPD